MSKDDMPEDPFQGEDWNTLADRALNDLLPMMKNSTLVVSMVPKGRTDVKFALELGFSIMLNKPIVAVVQPGTKVPDKMIAVADHIVEWDLNNDQGDLMARLKPIIDSIPIPKDDDD
jgi:hypothetical protein